MLKKLSIDDMLSEPYLDVSIDMLKKQYDLEINQFNYETYRHYTPRQLLDHYNVEVELARSLIRAPKNERKKLYSSVYNELFLKVPYHPQLRKKTDIKQRDAEVKKNVIRLKQYLRPDTTFLELGPGDCRLSFEVAKYVKKVYAIDVSSEVTRYAKMPENFQLIISDGSSVNVPAQSIDVAYSNQLMEHLHPDDVVAQLKAIYRALVPGGIYICTTPHRFVGPGDISKFFDDTPKGLHLKEYTNYELYRLLKDTGFKTVYSSRHVSNRLININMWPAIILECVISPFPHKVRRKIYKRLVPVLSLRVVAKS